MENPKHDFLGKKRYEECSNQKENIKTNQKDHIQNHFSQTELIQE